MESEIGISYKSDYSTVCMKLKFINQTRGRGTWKINNSLLTDTEFVNKVKQNINEVITEYEYDRDMDLENPEKTFRIDGHLLWETIKMKIRGTAISCSSYKNQKTKRTRMKIFCMNNKKNYIIYLLKVTPSRYTRRWTWLRWKIKF